MNWAARLKHPGWGVLLPLALTIVSTFSPVVVRGFCLVAALGFSVVVFHHTEFASRRIAPTVIAAIFFSVLYAGLFWLMTPGIRGQRRAEQAAIAPAVSPPRAAPPPPSSGVTTESTPTARIGLGVGTKLAGEESPFSDVCATPGVTCLSEESVQGKVLTLSLQGKNWARVVLLVNVYGDDVTVDDFHVLLSTLAEGVGLDYAGEKQLPSHGSLEFREMVAFSTALRREPYKYGVDLTVGQGVRIFPVTIAAWGSNMRTHVVTTQFRVVRKND